MISGFTEATLPQKSQQKKMRFTERLDIALVFADETATLYPGTRKMKLPVFAVKKNSAMAGNKAPLFLNENFQAQQTLFINFSGTEVRFDGIDINIGNG